MAAFINITPLSGEIMSGRKRAPASRPVAADVVDAVVIGAGFDQPSHRAGSRQSPAARPGPANGLDVFGRRADGPAQGRGEPQRGGALFWSGSAIVVLAAFWMSGGYALFDRILGGAGASRSVQVVALASQVVRSASGDHLVIDGVLENITDAATVAPDLEIAVAAVGGGVTRYRLGNAMAVIEPGEPRRFSSRLAAPPTGVRSVSVTLSQEE